MHTGDATVTTSTNETYIVPVYKYMYILQYCFDYVLFYHEALCRPRMSPENASYIYILLNTTITNSVAERCFGLL